MKKKIAIVKTKGGLQLKYDNYKKAKNGKIKRTPYEKYVMRAQEYGIPKSDILDADSYITTLVHNREKGRKLTPDDVARWQAQGGHTDKEIANYWKAAQRMGTNLTRKQFSFTGG